MLGTQRLVATLLGPQSISDATHEQQTVQYALSVPTSKDAVRTTRLSVLRVTCAVALDGP